MLRKVYGPNMEGGAGHWREMDNKKFRDLYANKILGGDQIENEMGRACST
jgi:hypothetical protein